MIQSPEPLQPLPPSEAGDRAAQRRCCARCRTRGSSTSRRQEAAIGAAGRRSRAAPSTQRGALLRGPRQAAARRALRRRRTSPPRTSPSTPRSTCRCRASPSTSSPRAWTAVEKMIKRKENGRPLQGAAHRHRALDGRRAWPWSAAAILRPSQYNRATTARAPAGQHLQALRLPGRLRGHLRRPRAAAHHPRHRGRGRAHRLLLRTTGVRAAELRGRLQGLRHPAHGARPQPQRRHGQGGGDDRLRPRGRPLDDEAGMAGDVQALPRHRPRRPSRPRRWRWPPPTTCSPTGASRFRRSRSCSVVDEQGNVVEQHQPEPRRGWRGRSPRSWS